MMKPVASSYPGTWFILNIASRIDPTLARWTKGRFTFVSLIGKKLAILTSVGAKTGKIRNTPLIYIPDGENIILIASRGGQPRNPGWYYNLLTNPKAKITVGEETRTYLAREVHGAERDALWKKAVALYSGYETYQKRAGERKIPVLVLTPFHEPHDSPP